MAQPLTRDTHPSNRAKHRLVMPAWLRFTELLQKRKSLHSPKQTPAAMYYKILEKGTIIQERVYTDEGTVALLGGQQGVKIHSRGTPFPNENFHRIQDNRNELEMLKGSSHPFNLTPKSSGS